MSVLNVVLFPDDPLTKKASLIEKVTPELIQLSADMLDTMHALEGVGLAAPQIGVAKRLIVLQEPEGEPMCLINPEIMEAEGSEFGEEGCLSVPRIYSQVPRATRIHVRAMELTGKTVEFEAADFLARIIQHETDHLDGVLFMDRVDVLTREALLQEWRQERERLFAGVVRT